MCVVHYLCPCSHFKVPSQKLPVANFQEICFFCAVCLGKKERGVKTGSSPHSCPRMTTADIFLSHTLSASSSGMLAILSDFNESVREFLLKGVCVGRVKDDLIPSRQEKGEKERKRLI